MTTSLVNTSLILFAKMAVYAVAIGRGFVAGVMISAEISGRVWRDA
jgi:hypothetical protein